MDSDAERQAEKQLVKSRSRIDEVVRELSGCEFRSKGPGDLWACCPFHTEDTPSFHVLIERGMFKCFGCQASGDVFSFVQKLRGITFREALEFLAERCGVTLGSTSPEDRRRALERRDLKDVLVKACELFTASLGGPAGRAATRYLAARGFDAGTARRFDVGFVPPDFMRQLRAHGLAAAAIDRAGFTQAFAGRLAFGIRDAHGALVGFGARTLEPDGKPKYVNTRETAAFNKRQLLYGLDKAARAVGRSRRLVIMEGYTDVMMAHQRGLEEAVATMGTSLTEDHVRLLRGRASNVVFLFDGDGPGLQAAERAVHLTLKSGLEVRVLCLPDDADPADWFATRDGAAFEELLEKAGLSTVAFLCQRHLARADRGQPGWRELVASEVLELSRTLVDPVRRETIAEEVSRACGMDRNLLRQHTRAAAPAAGDPRPGTPPRTSRSPAPRIDARTSSQFVALACLAERADGFELLAELELLGALDHAGAKRLLAVARTLGSAPVDGMEWLEAVRQREPALAPALERVLLDEGRGVLPPLADALAYLRRTAAEDRERKAQREALSRPDISHDDATLRAIHDSLRSRKAAAAAAARQDADQPATPRDRLAEDSDAGHLSSEAGHDAGAFTGAPSPW